MQSTIKLLLLYFIKHWRAINLYLSSVRYVQNQTTHTTNYAILYGLLHSMLVS